MTCQCQVIGIPYQIARLIHPTFPGVSAMPPLLFFRLMVGLMFLSSGILKFLPGEQGVVRFARVGIPAPEYLTLFFGVCEIVCGFLFLLGLPLASPPSP